MHTERDMSVASTSGPGVGAAVTSPVEISGSKPTADSKLHGLSSTRLHWDASTSPTAHGLQIPFPSPTESAPFLGSLPSNPSPCLSAYIPDAEATANTAELLIDSFQLELSAEKVELAKRRVLEELGDEFGVEECDGAEDIETLLDREAANGVKERTAFFLCDLGTVIRKYEQWNALMPDVMPCYAVKSNPDLAIVKALHLLGTGFDCASQQELELVLGIGCSPDKIVFANPCKMKSHILFAKKVGVKRMTFDNLDELAKIVEYFPEAELILRILPPDTSSALCNFGSKFGANKSMTKALLKQAFKLKANVCGVSFHVGSGCWSADAYLAALREAHAVMTVGREKYNFNMEILDIGGGFPAADNLEGIPSLPAIVEQIRPVINELFPEDSGYKLIAEPGRYFCGEAVVLAVTVIAKRGNVPASSTTVDASCDGEDETEVEEDRVLYYLSDGVYGSFNNIMFDHQKPTPRLTANTIAAAPTNSLKKSTLFGPTCDSIDVICRDVHLPEIDVGSFLYFFNMGAYTTAAASNFNGFSTPPFHYIIT